MPSDVILEGLYKSKLQDPVQLQTVLALYDQETARNSGKPNYSQLKTAVKLHIDQMMRTRNFRVRTDVVQRGSVTKSQKGKKAYVERKVRVFSVESTWQRPKGRPSSPAPNSKAKTDERGQKNPQFESSSDKRSEIPCRYRICQNPSCKIGHPPVGQNYQFENG